MSRGINETRDIARCSQMKPNYSNVKYNQYLANLLHHIKYGLATKSVYCKISFRPDYPGESYLDNERLGRIIENLAKNASKELV